MPQWSQSSKWLPFKEDDEKRCGFCEMFAHEIRARDPKVGLMTSQAHVHARTHTAFV